MVEKIKLEVTKEELDAIICMCDELEALIGGAEEDDMFRTKWVKLVRTVIKNNKIENYGHTMDNNSKSPKRVYV